MPKPVIMAVDDDPAVLKAITRDLQTRYAEDYQVVGMPSAPPALARLGGYALKDRPVAMIVSDQRMPSMTGIELLEQRARDAPEAKLVLLTAYADTDVAIKAINDIGLDHYLLKPWDPPEERLYPVIDDLLDDWHDAHPEQRTTCASWVIGGPSAATSVKTFLARNHVPYRWLDLERDEEAQRLHDLARRAARRTCRSCSSPTASRCASRRTLDVATALGLRTRAEQPLYDLCIVGGGPAGLAAAVYGASEGLQTVVVERDAPGGQAGQSAAIENYLGFPKGLSGADLAARGPSLKSAASAPRWCWPATSSASRRGDRCAPCASTTAPRSRRARVLVATGVSYRRLEAPGIDELTGRGVYYGASAAQFASVEGDDVYVVGAANSAGQAVAEPRALRPPCRAARAG